MSQNQSHILLLVLSKNNSSLDFTVTDQYFYLKLHPLWSLASVILWMKVSWFHCKWNFRNGYKIILQIWSSLNVLVSFYHVLKCLTTPDMVARIKHESVWDSVSYPWTLMCGLQGPGMGPPIFYPVCQSWPSVPSSGLQSCEVLDNKQFIIQYKVQNTVWPLQHSKLKSADSNGQIFKCFEELILQFSVFQHGLRTRVTEAQMSDIKSLGGRKKKEDKKKKSKMDLTQKTAELQPLCKNQRPAKHHEVLLWIRSMKEQTKQWKVNMQ